MAICETRTRISILPVLLRHHQLDIIGLERRREEERMMNPESGTLKLVLGIDLKSDCTDTFQ